MSCHLPLVGVPVLPRRGVVTSDVSTPCGGELLFAFSLVEGGACR